MNGTDYLQLLRLAAPETVLALVVFAILAVDGLWLRGKALELRLRWGVGLTAAGSGLAIVWLAAFAVDGNAHAGMFISDPLIRGVKVVLLFLTIFTALISLESKFTSHVGEYFALILLATLGMMFLVSSEQILMIFIALELTSLSLYILTAFHKGNLQSAEAALKYFLFGGTAAACTLFGLSLVYGISGETGLREIARGIRGFDPLLGLAIVLVVVGFGFKIAAVPFHLWAPDAYQGAPLPTAALIASGSKVASFFILAKVMILGFAGSEGSAAWGGFLSGWVPLLAGLAVISMIFGNVGALVQVSVRRLLAYSAVAHAGYMLLGVLAGEGDGMASLLYYLITYGVTAVGAFGVVSVVQEASGSDQMSAFAGLRQRAPILGLAMLVFMLSLAGIPPLAGFFGKFYLFAAAVNSAPANLALLWLVVVAVAMSAVSLYYYLIVLKQIFVAAPEPGAGVIRMRPLTRLVLVVLSGLVILLGCLPDLVLDRLQAATPQVASVVERR